MTNKPYEDEIEKMAKNTLVKLKAFRSAVNGYHNGWETDINNNTDEFDCRYAKADARIIANALTTLRNKTLDEAAEIAYHRRFTLMTNCKFGHKTYRRFPFGRSLATAILKLKGEK